MRVRNNQEWSHRWAQGISGVFPGWVSADHSLPSGRGISLWELSWGHRGGVFPSLQRLQSYNPLQLAVPLAFLRSDLISLCFVSPHIFFPFLLSLPEAQFSLPIIATSSSWVNHQIKNPINKIKSNFNLRPWGLHLCQSSKCTTAAITYSS